MSPSDPPSKDNSPSKRILTYDELKVELEASRKREKLLAKEFASYKKSATREIDKYKNLSDTDPLTGMFNRRYFNAQIEAAMDISQRLMAPASVIMFDVDHFKKVNDQFGHDGGDDVLKVLGKLAQKHHRPSDAIVRLGVPTDSRDPTAARLGGEEFALILPFCAPEDAMRVAEQLRQNIETTVVKSKSGDIKVTASFGVTTTTKDPKDTPASVYKRVDDALYFAKENGRNQVRFTHDGKTFMEVSPELKAKVAKTQPRPRNSLRGPKSGR